jgi:hypothetical protein
MNSRASSNDCRGGARTCCQRFANRFAAQYLGRSVSGSVSRRLVQSEDTTRQYYIEQGVYPPQKDTTSVTMSYAYKLARSTHLAPGLTFTNNPSFLTEPGQRHDLNFFIFFISFL